MPLAPRRNECGPLGGGPVSEAAPGPVEVAHHLGRGEETPGLDSKAGKEPLKRAAPATITQRGTAHVESAGTDRPAVGRCLAAGEGTSETRRLAREEQQRGLRLLRLDEGLIAVSFEFVLEGLERTETAGQRLGQITTAQGQVSGRDVRWHIPVEGVPVNLHDVDQRSAGRAHRLAARSACPDLTDLLILDGSFDSAGQAAREAHRVRDRGGCASLDHDRVYVRRAEKHGRDLLGHVLWLHLERAVDREAVQPLLPAHGDQPGVTGIVLCDVECLRVADHLCYLAQRQRPGAEYRQVVGHGVSVPGLKRCRPHAV